MLSLTHNYSEKKKKIKNGLKTVDTKFSGTIFAYSRQVFLPKNSVNEFVCN